MKRGKSKKEGVNCGGKTKPGKGVKVKNKELEGGFSRGSISERALGGNQRGCR